jgi:hypothetical protein
MSILQGKINLLDLEDILHNKIILLGDTHNPFDQHQTPIASNMPGIIINAHILATIQNNLYIDSTPNWINWCIAVAVGLLLSFMIVTFQTTNVLKSYTSFAIRIFQVLVIIVFLYIGCFIFAQWHYYCNFAPSLFMVGLGVLAVAVEPIVYLLLRTIIATIKYILNHTHNIVIFIIKTYRKTKYSIDKIEIAEEADNILDENYDDRRFNAVDIILDSVKKRFNNDEYTAWYLHFAENKSYEELAKLGYNFNFHNIFRNINNYVRNKLPKENEQFKNIITEIFKKK